MSEVPLYGNVLKVVGDLVAATEEEIVMFLSFSVDGC
jgi:hypothetical protein